MFEELIHIFDLNLAGYIDPREEAAVFQKV